MNKMQIFDLNAMEAYPQADRDKNVFYKTERFKTRIIELPPGSEIPPCEMTSHVILFVVKGIVEVTVNKERAIIRNGQCLITEPATLSMKSENGAKLMGIQIERPKVSPK